MRIKDRRVRKCGPEYPVVVAQCTEHGCCFTLYPLGWAPYGRDPVVDVEHQGDWKRTLFRIILVTVAAASSRELDGHRRTRHRWIARAARWLGLAGEAAAGQEIAGRLRVGLAVHGQKRRAYVGARLWSERARCVDAILRACSTGADLLWGLLACGHVAGVVGRPWRVCASSGALAEVR